MNLKAETKETVIAQGTFVPKKIEDCLTRIELDNLLYSKILTQMPHDHIVRPPMSDASLQVGEHCLCYLGAETLPKLKLTGTNL